MARGCLPSSYTTVPDALGDWAGIALASNAQEVGMAKLCAPPACI